MIRMHSRAALLLVLALVGIFSFSLTNARRRRPKLPAYIVEVSVTRVVDGDTVKARILNGSRASLRPIRVRLTYIDSPEKTQPYGMEATRVLQQLLAERHNETSRLAVYHHDHYGRALAVLFSGNMDLNRKMVAKGYAWCYRNRCPMEYKQDYRTAVAQKLGLFQDSSPVRPWTYRKQQRKLRSRKRG